MSDRRGRDAGEAMIDPADGLRRGPVEEGGSGRAASGGRSAFAFGESDDESIPGLLRRLADQSGHLAQQHVELIQAEVRASVDDLKEAGGAMAGAALVGIAALGVLLMGLSFLLGEFMALWLATLIVAAAAMIGAFAMFAAGRRKLQSGNIGAVRSRRTLERAPDAISGNLNEDSRRDPR